MVNFENPEARRLQSPEQQEGERREPQQEEPRPIETVESLNEKISGIDERIGDYSSSIEDTSNKLTQVRGELDLAPMTTEAPSITQSRETVARLDAEKQKILAQREVLGGGEKANERPKRLKDDPRFRELWDTTPLQMIPKAFEVHEHVVETLFRQRYPEDAATYDAIDQKKYQEEQSHKDAERHAKRQAEAERLRTQQKAAADAAVDARVAAQERERQSVALDPKLMEGFRAEKEVAEETRDAYEVEQRKIRDDILNQLDSGTALGKKGAVDTAVPKTEKPADQLAELRARQAVRLEALKKSDISPEKHKKILDEYVAESATISEMRPTSGSRSELNPVGSSNVEKESIGIDRVNLERNLGNLWAEAGLTQSPEIDALKLQIQTASADDAKRLNDALTKATRMYARTRNSDILAQTLKDLSTNDGRKNSESARSSIGNDETRGVYSELGVTTPDIALDTQTPPTETKTPDTAKILQQETSKRERTSSTIMQFAQSPELFLDQIKDSDADYSPKKGIKALVDAFKSLYPDPSQRAERLQSIYAAYKTTQEAFQGKHPEKGTDYAANYASKQTTVGLPPNEAGQLQKYIKEKLDIVTPSGRNTFFTTEGVMTDFLRFLDNINS